MGYHMGSMLNHLKKAKKNDFVEMALHDVAALILIGGCYMINQWEVGCIISFLHDIADIFTCSTRFLSESNIKTLTVISFISLMVSWFETRLIVFP